MSEGEGREPRKRGILVSREACPSSHSAMNKVGRAVWGCVWALLFRPSPKPLFAWRRLLLRLFGARVGRGVEVMPSTKIWAPWNLTLGENTCLSHSVDCYCVAPVTVGANATVSQYSFICTATHDIDDPHMRLVTAPVVIGDGAWVCADVFISPGVSVGEGAVIGARSSVFEDMPAWTVCVGHPCKPVRPRVLRNDVAPEPRTVSTGEPES